MLTIQLSARNLVLALLALAGLWLLVRLWPIFVIVAAAFIFMAALLPYVDWLMRRGLHRVAAVLVLLFAILLALTGMGFLVLTALISEIQDVRESLPENAASLDRFLSARGLETNLEAEARDIDWNALVSGRTALDLGQRVVTGIIGLITIIVLTAYLLVDAPRLATFLFQFISPGHEPAVQRFLATLRLVVGGYIRGQFITSLVIAAFTSAVMFALGLPNALAFGVFAAFADIIPLVGATLAIGPPVLVALQESPAKALIVLAALVGYQQFEDRFLTPRVYGSTLNLPPLIVLVAVLIGAELFGISGVLLALPAAAVARVLLDYYLERRAFIISTPCPPDDVLAPDQPDGPAAPQEDPHG